jgi:hypothetical protein
VLSVLIAVAGGSFAAQQAEGPKVFEVEKLKDNLFVLKAAGAIPRCSSPPGRCRRRHEEPRLGPAILDKIKS